MVDWILRANCAGPSLPLLETNKRSLASADWQRDT